MKKISLLIVMIISLSFALATINEYYGFNATAGAYVPITGTAITSIHVDDALSSPIPIGFAFSYGELSFSQVQVSSNGWVGLGTTHPNSTLNNALASLTRIPVVAPLWDDLSMASGNVQYLTTGTAPNRVFTVQFTNAKWNFNSPGLFSFQARLYENSKIDLVYGTATGAPNLPSASIGINMTPGGSGWFYSVSPSSSTASTTVENATVNAFPATGTIYEFNPIIIPANDLMALSVSGNSTPTVGDQNLYTAQIRNRGTSPQTNYLVKLFLTGDVELASVNGPVIPADEVLSVSLAWTPTVDGPTSLFARVVLAGDQEPSNDQSPAFGIIVMPQGVVTVGDGSVDARVPFDMFYKNSLHQTIYYPAELGQTGTINAIALFNQFTTATLTASPIKLWIGTTPVADLTSGWIPSSQLNLVYDGNIAMPAGVNAITIPLSTPFNYTGGNLVLMFYRPMDTGYYSYMDNFKCQSVGTNRARNMFSDSIPFDPAAPMGGTLTGQFPKTSFYMGPHPTEPIFAINPSAYSFGNISVGNDVNQRFTISNAGAGSLTLNSITITGHNAFTLSSLPALPATLASGASIQFVANYAPESVGNNSAVIAINYDPARVTHSVSLTGIGVENNAEIDPPQNLTANVEGSNVHLNWDALIPPIEGFFDDFESYEDFLLNFPPWICVDLDLSSTYAISGYSWPHDYEAQAYIIWNSSATTPPWTNPDAIPHSGSKQVACFSSFISPPNNDWLISPPLEITSYSNTLSFWAKSLTDVFGLERFKVGISTTGASPSDFSIISGATYIEAPSVWTQYIYDLSAYTGQRIRFAIQCVSYDSFIFFIDDVALDAGPENAGVRLTTRNMPGYRIYRDGTLIGSIADPGINSFVDTNLPNGNYSYGVSVVYSNGESYPASVEVTVNAVNNDDSLNPAIITKLKGNYPNPFNPDTAIRFSLKETSPVSINIYDVKGQLVKTLVNEVREAGNHSVIWKGVDNNGRAVSSGVYFYRMSSRKFSSTRKMILIK